MKRAPVVALMLLAASVAACVAAPAARSEVSMRSALAPPLVEPGPGGEPPVLILAQRVIDRSWGPVEGAPPPPIVPGMISEGRALALSAVVPGAGQLYAGESSGLWFMLAEVAGWTTHWLYTRDANRERERADRYAGAPTDPGSTWSFERWVQAGSGRDTTALEALYVGDKQSFYNLIARDPTYLDGWSGPDPYQTRADFQHLRDLSDGSLDRASLSQKGLWLNHFLSAFDALRAARIHNLPIRRNLELQIKSSWHRGGPEMTASLERRF